MMPEPDDIHEQTYELVYPFIHTKSHGGPYEDEAFVAGFHCGRIERLMAIASNLGQPCEFEAYYSLYGQIDLMAAHHGYTVECRRTDESLHPDWATFMCSLPAHPVDGAD